MSELFKAVKITDKVWWVGAIDWNLRDFHGFTTQAGTTYNAYLVIDKKIALIDTVKRPFADELLSRISSVISFDKIDFVITNHVEMDHSGSLDVIRSAAKNAQFVTNKRAAEDLNRHFKSNWNFNLVKTGDSISLGNLNLTFVEIPMAHWPDSMMTYCPEQKLLFPNDAFGQHMARSARFDDELPLEEILNEAKKYYANILHSLHVPVSKALAAASKLEIGMIAPSHGTIWRSHVKDIISHYSKWVSNKMRQKAVIVYGTMWNSTEKMATSIAEGLILNGIETRVFNLGISDPNDVMKEIMDASALVIGTPTLHNYMLPSVAGFIAHIRGLKPRDKIGFSFGSYGWAGGGTKVLELEMTNIGIEITQPAINAKYIPDPSDLEKCVDAGKQLAELIKKKII